MRYSLNNLDVCSLAPIVAFTAIFIGIFLYMTGRADEINKLFKVFAAVYDYITDRIAFFTGTNKSLASHIIKKYKRFTQSEFNSDNYTTSDIYWLSYCYVASKSNQLHSNLVNWLHMYSYARNISTALYLCSIYLMVIISWHKLQGYNIDMVSYFGMVGLFISAFIMLIRFYYLYVSYYTKFLVRACVFLDNEEEKVTTE